MNHSTPGLPAATAAAKSLQSCPTLCDPIDGSSPGSTVPGILQARTLEWVAISFSNTWKWKVKVKLLSRVRLLATPWTAAYQAPPSMEFSRQEYWSGVPLPSPQENTAQSENVTFVELAWVYFSFYRHFNTHNYLEFFFFISTIIKLGFTKHSWVFYPLGHKSKALMSTVFERGWDFDCFI